MDSYISGYFESSSPDSDAEFLAQLGGSGSAFSIMPQSDLPEGILVV